MKQNWGQWNAKPNPHLQRDSQWESGNLLGLRGDHDTLCKFPGSIKLPGRRKGVWKRKRTQMHYQCSQSVRVSNPKIWGGVRFTLPLAKCLWVSVCVLWQKKFQLGLLKQEVCLSSPAHLCAMEKRTGQRSQSREKNSKDAASILCCVFRREEVRFSQGTGTCQKFTPELELL